MTNAFHLVARSRVNFSNVGPSDSDECAKLMHIFTSVCKNLGVPIATDKTEGPSLTEQLNEINNHKKVTLQQLQSLCELLAFCSRSLPPARALIRRFYRDMAGVHKPHHMIRVNSGMKQDAMTLLKYLHSFNGTCQFPDQLWSSNNDLEFSQKALC